MTPLAILNGHEHEVTCVAVSSSMGRPILEDTATQVTSLVASGAKCE